MQRKNVLVCLFYSAYVFNMLSMQICFTSNSINLHGPTGLNFTSSIVPITKPRLDQTKFKDRRRKAKQPQCLYCERFLNEPNTRYKCDACKDTKINVILKQRFTDKIRI